MGESRWMKQTHSKIRVGPEYQAVVPDLIVPEKKTQDKKDTELGVPNGTKSSSFSSSSSSSSNTARSSIGTHQNHRLKITTQSLATSNKSSRSEKDLSRDSKITTFESSNKPKSSIKTQKTISKTKTNNKTSSKSSK